MCVLVAQSWLALFNPMDCSPPGSSVHGILQAKIPLPSPGNLPDLGIEPRCLALQADSLLSEDPLEKGIATHSSIVAWRIPETEEPGGLQSMGSQETNTHTHTHTQTQLKTKLPAKLLLSSRQTKVNREPP